MKNILRNAVMVAIYAVTSAHYELFLCLYLITLTYSLYPVLTMDHQ